jgi:hypothetical protein
LSCFSSTDYTLIKECFRSGFSDASVIHSIADDIEELIQKALQKCEEDMMILNVYFGQKINPAFKTLGQKTIPVI